MMYLNDVLNLGVKVSRKWPWIRHQSRLFSSVVPGWQVCIGLEVHVQLTSSTKLFSGAPALGSGAGGAAPNAAVAAFDAALPGTLPRANAVAVRRAIALGLALQSKINPVSIFERKHYFYCDLPHGFQITQHRHPIASGGTLKVMAPHLDSCKQSDGILSLDVTRIQLEIDSGKTDHDMHPTQSLVDLNRAGVALLEVVFEPGLSSGEEAAATVRELQRLVRVLGVSEANLEEGHVRADLNVSVRREGRPGLGERAEVKNVNSLRALARAADHEARRQVAILEAGGTVERETRGFNAVDGTTFRLRGKEGLVDYRFLPEPDLPPLAAPPALVQEVRRGLPSPLPHERYARLLALGGGGGGAAGAEGRLAPADAYALVAAPGAADYFEKLVLDPRTGQPQRHPKVALNWMLNPLAGLLSRSAAGGRTEGGGGGGGGGGEPGPGAAAAAAAEAGLGFSGCPVRPARLGGLLDLLAEGRVSGNIAKKILEVMFKEEHEATAVEIAEKRDWLETDLGETTNLDELCQQVVEDKANKKQLDKYLKGKGNMQKFFVGQAMRAAKGKANPALLEESVARLLAQKKKNQQK